MLSRLWRLCGRRFNRVQVKKIEEEQSQHYEVGRYFPVRIGDTLGKRYQILGKLGWGQFSTVWFAKNVEDQQWVSVKVCTQTLMKDPWHERDIMRKLNEGDVNHPGYSRVVHLLDSFELEGVNGQHVCLVYKAMGESLSRFQAKCPEMKLPLPVMKRVTRQLLEALDYTHSCGIIHTDIYHKNILCELDEHIVQQYLKDVPKASELAKLGPEATVRSTGMRAPKDLQNNFNIRLADFGQASYFPKRGGDDNEAQMPTMRAPEIVLGLPWDTKADIWNLACFVWEAFEARWMFDGQLDDGDKYSPKGHLSEIVYFFGPAPEKLVSRQVVRFLNSDGRIQGVAKPLGNYWKELEENLSGDEQEHFFDFITHMLQWLPEDRPTAKEALEHKWLAS